MNRFSLLVLILLAFSQCKKDDPEPFPEIALIVGKWRVVSYSRTVGDSLITSPVSKENSSIYEFRFDGVLLNEKGNMPCCLPQKYIFNGNVFEAKPHAPVLPDPSCIYVDCAPCPEMKITRPMADSLLIETCEGFYTSLVREM
jgi:hypothetical protein